MFLIDTYDTMGSGIKNAILAGKKLVERGKKFGVRLDSGDIDYLTREVRKELDDAGLGSASIVVSNELDEEIIEHLVADKAPVDTWGVGTHLVTGGKEASFTGVVEGAGLEAGPLLLQCQGRALRELPGRRHDQPSVAEALKQAFYSFPEVLVYDSLFQNVSERWDCMTSAANSFGIQFLL